ncbi:Abi family protein [Oryzibacter oryziterrae]|uniref:Abi family protein n=1 Tax=Oryzibacter oryziterrae TaxID=2766474 RepID=UPI001F40DB9F|nr:Abi family protein [Oryzibacter oryziterrae]
MQTPPKNQLIPRPTPDQVVRLETVMQPQRISRYLPAAEFDRSAAFEMYLWNCELSEAFYIPLHFAEIIIRNAIHNALLNRLGESWFEHQTFLKVIDPRFRSELEIAIDDEREQHGSATNSHHIASALTFGFWEHLTTKRFDRMIWSKGIRYNFPNAHHLRRREDLQRHIESIRRWRNRIAHHRAIFDKEPVKKHQEIVEVINWVCTESASWVNSASRVMQTIASRPTPPSRRKAEGATTAP